LTVDDGFIETPAFRGLAGRPALISVLRAFIVNNPRSFRLKTSGVQFFLASLLLLTACACGDKLSGPALSGSPAQNAGNFSNVVFLGDSLAAGFQSGSLLDSQQPNGYANLIAQQAKFSIELPLIAPPGAPAVLQLVSLGPPPVITPVSGTSTGRDNLKIQPTDLAVPGHTLNDLISTAPSLVPSTGQETITYLVLGFPGIQEGVQYTQLQWAHQLNPTTIFLWIGNNDALVADFTGSPASMTPVATFTTQYTTLMQTLKATTRANLIVANIPDVTGVAYMTPGVLVLGEYSQITGIPAAQLSLLTGVQPTDLLNPTGLAEFAAILQGKQKGPVDDSGSLTAAEAATVQQTVQAYNQVIAQQVAAVGGTVVDIYTATNGLRLHPPVVNGYPINFGFLGGFFSLDGIHPTNTGYAITANAFIQTMNAALGTNIPVVDVSAIAAKDPLFPPNLAHAAITPAHISADAGKSVQWMFRR
jgi:lysophospholipase L1-like esterase